MAKLLIKAHGAVIKEVPLEKSRLTVVVNPVMLECPECRCLAPFPVGEHTHAHELIPGVACPVCGQLARLTRGQGVESIELVFGEEDASLNP